MFEYFHDMLRFGAFYRKIGIKTSDFRRVGSISFFFQNK